MNLSSTSSPIRTLARTLLLGLLVMAGAAGCTNGDPAPERLEPDPAAPLAGRNLLFITLDTTRADALSCYGAAPGTTPMIDQIGAEGTIFERAYSQTNSTNSSHVAMFTGRHAIDTTILNNETTAPEDLETLPAAFQRHGYRTGGFPAVPHASEILLDLPGFDMSYELTAGILAQDVIDRTIDWITEPSDDPFFAWVHFYDPHTPYSAPPPYPQRFYKGDPWSGDSPPIESDPAFRLAPVISREQFTGLRDLSYPWEMYRAELRYTDDQIARLVTRLKDAGLYDDTAIVIVSDHGESFGEHDIYYSHFSLYDTNLVIPLVVRFPGFPIGVRSRAAVTHLDLVPTLTEAFGITMDPVSDAGFPGRSLLGALRSDDTAIEPRETFVHEHAYNNQVAVREGPWKAIFRIVPSDYDIPEEQLFHTERDPGETRNLARSERERLAAMRAVAEPWIEQGAWTHSNEAPATEAERRAFEENRERLRRLGYLDYATSDVENADTPGKTPREDDDE